MAQRVLPILPSGCTPITDTLSVVNEAKQWTYFHGLLPVFMHDAEDLQSFRMFTAQLAATGACKQVDIQRTFGIASITVKRAVSLYRTGGCRAFFRPRKGRGPEVLKHAKVQELQLLLDTGMRYQDAAQQAKVNKDTVRKGIDRGLLRELLKKVKPLPSADLEKGMPYWVNKVGCPPSRYRSNSNGIRVNL
jgi:hypothetical protein